METQLARMSNSGAYLVTRRANGAVADKPFNITYRAFDLQGNLVLINGDQVTKMTGKKVTGGWEITFHLSDGTTFTPSQATEWANKFVEAHFPDAPK